jgi:hypothetical protein
LLEQVGAAAKSAGTVIVLFIDELQYLKEDQSLQSSRYIAAHKVDCR